MTKTERERERERRKRRGWGVFSNRRYTYYKGGVGETEKFTALKVTRQYPVVLLVKVRW